VIRSRGARVSSDLLPALQLSRFELLGRLCKGAQGAVYEALDREQQRRVALKTIGLRAPDHVLRFKNEFRALRDVRHPNLVRLGELLHESGQWFYTMELVEGVDLIQHIRGPAATTTANESSTIRMPHMPPASAAAALEVPAGRALRGFDETRLRGAFAQLAAALGAIHGAGMRGLVYTVNDPAEAMRLDARRVEIRMDDNNAPSWRVAERAGFTLEALLRFDSATPAGEPRSTRIYARVRGAEEPVAPGA